MFALPRYGAEGDAFVGVNQPNYNNRPLYDNQISAVVIAGDRPIIRYGQGKVLEGTYAFAFVRAGTVHWFQNLGDVTSKYRPDRMEWNLGDPALSATRILLEAVPPADGPGVAIHLRVDGALPGDELVWAKTAPHTERESILWAWDVTTAGRDALLQRGLTQTELQAATTGRIPVENGRDLYWAVGDSANPPSKAFVEGIARAKRVEGQISVDTPDARFNAVVAASTAVMDGVYRNGFYTHAGMRWGTPLLGWRTLYGATAYGYHDRVLTQARSALARQVTAETKPNAIADPQYGLSSQAPNSRLFGEGRVDAHQPFHYDMQTQFFDQLIHAWRWTADPELERLLRPALELHLKYLHDCFDPDDDGLYESYANTWPTDDQWYNGGGTAEETAYAYRGEVTAAELDRRAGDTARAGFHAARAAKILRAFHEKLWVASESHVGSYVEQGGHQRLHTNPWLYAIFCPIDSGMLSPTQAVQSLAFTEWGLERERMPYGGERCWTSNWVPSIWSVRELWPGDNYALALAYEQTGLAEKGWDVLRGNFPCMAFYGPVPGDLGYPNGATDFNDCASMFCRTVVEGLFGYRPDYPNHHVLIAPQLPASWDHASIRTPDVSIELSHGTLTFTLAQPAAVTVDLPVAGGIERFELASTRSGTIDPLLKSGVRRLLPAPGPIHEHAEDEAATYPHFAPPRRSDALVASWTPIALTSVFNGDIREIFQQKYLSPRPATCSLRLATDGYSTWQMMLDPKHKVPVIQLDGAPTGHQSNIALTSLWDNWPHQITVPIHQSAAGARLLLCGFTDPMQVRISNAEIRLRYADGVVQKVELIPPLNFWSLCPYGGVDYNYDRDGFALPKTPPTTVQLGANCRAIQLDVRLRAKVALEDVTLETLSPEAIIGLMKLSLTAAAGT